MPGVMNPTAGGSAEWAPDNGGFYYTRYPQEGERPPADRQFYQTVWFHQLGTPVSADRFVIGRDFPRIAEIVLTGSRDGNYLLAKVHNGDGGDVAFHVRDPAGQWTQVAGIQRWRQAGRVRRRRPAVRQDDQGRAAAARSSRFLSIVPRSPTPSSSFRKRTSSPKPSRRRRRGSTSSTATGVCRPCACSASTASDGRHPGRTRCPIPAIGDPLSGDDLMVQHDELPVAAHVVPLRSRARPARAHATHRQARVQLRRCLGRARRRDFQGRHEGSDQHPVPQGHEARRAQSGDPVRATAATASA